MLVFENILQLQQSLYETLSWERMLDYFLQESAYLKVRLAQFLDNTTDKEFINVAESFQTIFIDTDVHMTDLKNDVLSLQKLTQDCLMGKNIFTQKIVQQKARITKDVGYFEKRFPMLKTEFNEFLTGAIHKSEGSGVQHFSS